jgi:hypothetical protein
MLIACHPQRYSYTRMRKKYASVVINSKNVTVGK